MIKAFFIIDPIDRLSVKKDSTLALLWEAQQRDWLVTIAEQHELFYSENRVYARMRPLRLLDISGSTQADYELGKAFVQPLAEADLVMMRKDPPFDMDYIYTTYLLGRVEREGVLVCNRPASLRDCNEKFFATRFPDCVPPLVVAADKRVLLDFHTQYEDIVVKPLDGMGGEGVFRIRKGDKNRHVIIDTLTAKGRCQIMAQRFLPEIAQGDKRILMVDGRPVGPALARIPTADENRANLAAGGKGRVCELTERDRKIADQVGPALRELGLLFVGLDVIGDYLTEVNVTCPTGIREIFAQAGVNVAAELLDSVQRRLEKSE